MTDLEGAFLNDSGVTELEGLLRVPGGIPASLLGLTVRIAAGVPAGAPATTELPIAVDTTGVSGGIYAWNGSAWVKAATI